MKRLIFSAAAASAALAVSAQGGSAPTPLPIDQPAQVGGLEVACTGVGQTREDPVWGTYPVRVEFSNALNEYLVDGEVILRDSAGRVLLDVACEAPWVLIRLPPGDYRVEGRLLGSEAKPRSARFHPPAEGQMRLVLQFPDA